MIVMEIIEWLDVNKSLPDDEMTVPLYHPSLNEPVWLGYFNQHFFYDVQGDQHPNGTVTHWAEMPYGPEEAESRRVGMQCSHYINPRGHKQPCPPYRETSL